MTRTVVNETNDLPGWDEDALVLTTSDLLKGSFYNGPGISNDVDQVAFDLVGGRTYEFLLQSDRSAPGPRMPDPRLTIQQYDPARDVFIYPQPGPEVSGNGEDFGYTSVDYYMTYTPTESGRFYMQLRSTRDEDDDGRGFYTFQFTDVTSTTTNIEGSTGADTLITAVGGDQINLGGGADQVQGPLDSFYDDEISGFGADDVIVFDETIVSRDQLTVTKAAGSTVVDVDQDKDGTADGSFTLTGDFSGGDLMAVRQGADTHVSYETYLPSLAEGVAVAADKVNGINNQGFLTGDDTSGFRVTLDSAKMGAAFDNTLGVYELDRDGNIENVRILAANVKDAVGTSFDISPLATYDLLGFFVIQDGAGLAKNWSSADTFAFVDKTLTVNGEDVEAEVFHSISSALNSDGKAHVLSGVDPGGKSITIGFEDMIGGDDDFQDVVFSVSTFSTFEV